MVIRPDVIERAILSIESREKQMSHRIYLTPSGKSLNQQKLENLVKFDELIIKLKLQDCEIDCKYIGEAKFDVTRKIVDDENILNAYSRFYD